MKGWKQFVETVLKKVLYYYGVDKEQMIEYVILEKMYLQGSNKFTAVKKIVEFCFCIGVLV